MSYEMGSGSAGHSKIVPVKGVSQGRGASIVPWGAERLVHGDRTGPPPRSSSRSVIVSVNSVDSRHVRVGMDGTAVQTDEEQDPSSSDDEDWGGPRFAAPSGTLQGGSNHLTVIHSIEEGLNESTTSM